MFFLFPDESENHQQEVHDENHNEQSENEICDEIRQDLFEKLSDFGTKMLLEDIKNISEASVTEWIYDIGGQVAAKCRISCLYCEKTYLVKFDGKWHLSNIYKHFRKHLDRAKQIEVQNIEVVEENADEFDEIEAQNIVYIDENAEGFDQVEDDEFIENEELNQIDENQNPNLALVQTTSGNMATLKTLNVVIEKLQSPDYKL